MAKQLGPWSISSLLRECMALLRDRNTRVTFRFHDPSKKSADSEYSDHERKITIDASQDGYVSSMIHELLHMVLDRDISERFNEDVQEAIISGLEQACYRRVSKSKYMMRTWREEIVKRTRGRS